MARRFDVKNASKDVHIKSEGDELVPLTVVVKPEIKRMLEAIARESRMDVSQMAGILLGAQIKNHNELVKSIEQKAAESLDKEFNRLVSLLLRGKEKPGSSN